MILRRRTFLRTLGAGAALPWLAAGFATPPAPWPPPAEGADDDAFWAVVRSQYPLTRERTYFNTGGLGPAPYPVLDAAHRTTLDLQRLSETGHDRLEAARAPVATFLGCAPEALAFVRNATEGNSTVAAGLKTLGRGDEVIFESHAHPGGSIPWMNRAKQQGIRVKIFEPDPASVAGNVARIERLITPRTKAIQVSHVTAPTGIRMPVEAIGALARARRIWFHVDGAQSLGMFPFAVRDLGCDSYAASGHKWLGAPHGTGVLYVRPDRLDEVAPTETGAYSDAGVELPDRFEYNRTAQRYEPGTRDVAQVVGLQAATAFMSEIGMDRVAAHGQGLARRAAAGLRALPGVEVLTPTDPALAASITTFRAARVPYDRLTNYLLATHKMRCRVVTEQGLNAIRVSTHVFTSAADVDRLVAAVRQGLTEA